MYSQFVIQKGASTDAQNPFIWNIVGRNFTALKLV